MHLVGPTIPTRNFGPVSRPQTIVPALLEVAPIAYGAAPFAPQRTRVCLFDILADEGESA